MFNGDWTRNTTQHLFLDKAQFCDSTQHFCNITVLTRSNSWEHESFQSFHHHYLSSTDHYLLTTFMLLEGRTNTARSCGNSCLPNSLPHNCTSSVSEFICSNYPLFYRSTEDEKAKHLKEKKQVYLILCFELNEYLSPGYFTSTPQKNAPWLHLSFLSMVTF